MTAATVVRFTGPDRRRTTSTMTMTARCTVDGCANPHRARGLCSTHYNQAHQPERHRKVTVACDWCGSLCIKSPTSPWTLRFCSLRCRENERFPPRSAIPATHPARWIGAMCGVKYGNCEWCDATFATQADSGRRYCGSRCACVANYLRTHAAHTAVEVRDCAWCESPFVVNLTHERTLVAECAYAYCSPRCVRRVRKMKRRAREYEVLGVWTWGQFMRIARRFDYCCAYCGDKPSDPLDPDHVLALSRGGPNVLNNLLPAYRACNCDKRDLTLAEWDADRLRRGLAPRRTSWAPEDQRYWHLTYLEAA